MNEKFTFFYGGPFSQWHYSKFVVNNVEYGTAEQFMMAEKARLFSDNEILTKIMNAKTPKEQKALGRLVKNFDKTKWEAKVKDILFVGNMAKFSQNEHLKKALLETKETTLVEASPVDRIYGIGLSESNPLRFDRSKWKGTNWLGESLTAVREALFKLRTT